MKRYADPGAEHWDMILLKRVKPSSVAVHESKQSQFRESYHHVSLSVKGHFWVLFAKYENLLHVRK